MAKSAIGYLRVSTVGQAEEGVSLDAQRAKVEAWCLANDVELSGMFVDAGVSGKRADNRPQLQAALEAVCRSGGVLVVYSLSRLARSTKDTIHDRDENPETDGGLTRQHEELRASRSPATCSSLPSLLDGDQRRFEATAEVSFYGPT